MSSVGLANAKSRDTNDERRVIITLTKTGRASVAMTISVPGMDHDAAQALVVAAHEVCPYSNATRGNIDVALTVV